MLLRFLSILCLCVVAHCTGIPDRSAKRVLGRFGVETRSHSLDDITGAEFDEAFARTGLTDASLDKALEAHQMGLGTEASSFLSTGRAVTTMSCTRPSGGDGGEGNANERLSFGCCKEARALERVASTELMLSYINLGDAAVTERVRDAVKHLSKRETGSLMLSLVLSAVAGPLAGQMMGSVFDKAVAGGVLDGAVSSFGGSALSAATVKQVRDKAVGFVAGKVKGKVEALVAARAPGLGMDSDGAKFVALVESFFKDSIEELMRSTRIALKGPEPGDFGAGNSDDDLMHELSRASLSARCERAAEEGDEAAVESARGDMARLRRMILTGLAMKTSDGNPANVKDAWERIFKAAQEIGKMGLDKRGSFAGTRANLELQGTIPAFLVGSTDAEKAMLTPPGSSKPLAPLAMISMSLAAPLSKKLSAKKAFGRPTFKIVGYVPRILGLFTVFLSGHRDMEIALAHVGRVEGVEGGAEEDEGPMPPSRVDPAASPNAFYDYAEARKSSFAKFVKSRDMPHILSKTIECTLAQGRVFRVSKSDGGDYGHCATSELHKFWTSVSERRCPSAGLPCGEGRVGNAAWRHTECDGVCICEVVVEDRACRCVSRSRFVDAPNCEWVHNTYDMHWAGNESPYRMFFRNNAVSDYAKKFRDVRHDNQRRRMHSWMERHEYFHRGEGEEDAKNK